MNYHYFVFGLQVQSEIELPELLSGEEGATPDVVISIGRTPVNLANCQKKGVAYEVAKDEFLLDLKDIARFYVANGNSIMIEPSPKSEKRDIRLFLLGSCFSAILHQRKILALHASCIEHEGEAVLFTGISGVGKSTTANAFRLQGHKMLTDDVCPIKIIDGQPYAIPGYPQSKMWEDVLEKMEIDFEHLRHIRQGINKRAVPIKSEFVTTPLPIKAIYILQTHNKPELECLTIEDATKFRVIKNMTYRKYLVRDLGAQPHHFRSGIQIANRIPIKRILRSQSYCLPDLVSLILQDLEQLNSMVV